MSSLPSIFDATGDIYTKYVYLYKLQAIGKDETTINAIIRKVEAKDINRALKGCYDMLAGLKDAFSMPNQPDYMKGVE